MVHTHRCSDDSGQILAKGIAVGSPALDPEVIKAAKEVLSQQEIAVLGLPAPERSER